LWLFSGECMRVLVLDGNENHSVAAVRSLAAAGHEVIAGAESGWSKAGWSRGAKASFVYPAAATTVDLFIKNIVEEIRHAPGTLVLPMTERTTLPISAYRQQILDAGGKLVLSPHETVLRAFDKRQTTALAESLGIAIPQTAFISTRGEAEQYAASGPFPVVLKARSSEELSADGSVLSTGAPLYARDGSEFMRAYEKMRSRCSALLAQEFVVGRGTGYFALMHEGELRAEFAHRRIRDVRPTGSGSAVRESVQPDERTRAAALSILKALRWHGVAMVEFRTRPDGTPVFLEVNGRFWNSLPLAVYAGVDFPALLARMAEEGDVETQTGYQTGVRCRWLLGDFRHLIEVWRGAPAGYPERFPGRLRTLTEFLLPVAGTRHDNFQWRDPLPELGDWLDFLTRKIPAQLKKKSVAEKEVHAQSRSSLS
jgi:predicted ATP-grasp superfamily ATP-dependent carboligase